MKSLILLTASVLIAVGTMAQSYSAKDNDTKKVINGKKFHVLYKEIEINKTVDETWNEVAINFIKIDEVVKSVDSTRCLSGDTTYGLGTKRQCFLKYQGKDIQIKEEIIKYIGKGNQREFTYDVYDAPKIPLKNYVTWIVRKDENGKVYLGTAFVFRANLAFLTGVVAKKLQKDGGLRDGILAYKHFLETGEKKVKPEKLRELY